MNERFLTRSGVIVNDFQWKIAALFHDIGYPAQIAKDIFLGRLADNINKIKIFNEVDSPKVDFQVRPKGFENLTNKVNSLNLMQQQINKWNLQINAGEQYEMMIEENRVCHGIISGLAVLKVVDAIYQKYNPKRKYEDVIIDNVNFNQIYFDNDIILACSAIFIHNLPPACFSKARIDRQKAPLAFLLKLSDCLQEWERPSLINPEGFSPSLFEIRVEDNHFALKARIPSFRKNEIRKEIQSALIADDIQII